MSKLSITEIKNNTIIAIENTPEYKYIMRKIKERSDLGYSYVKVEDNELLRCINSFSISEYLQSLGYMVSNTIIRWSL